jgi:hypothetical protein
MGQGNKKEVPSSITKSTRKRTKEDIVVTRQLLVFMFLGFIIRAKSIAALNLLAMSKGPRFDYKVSEMV